MAEDRSEIEKSPAISVESILRSIEESEGWWPKLKSVIDQGQPVRDFISDAIELLNQMESVAQNPHLPQTKEEAEKIKALWTISAPGTYSQAQKNDRYKDKKWALWNDRQRINYAFRVGRQIAETKLGHPISKSWANSEKELNGAGPLIIYNGTPQENVAILEAIKTPWFRIPQGLEYPKSKLFIINPLLPIDNTNDQIRSFHLSPGMVVDPGDEIGLIIHAPQAVRFLYSLAKSDVISSGVNIRVFPLPTPEGGYPDYPLQELRGTVNYRFIADPPKVAEKPFPYKI